MVVYTTTSLVTSIIELPNKRLVIYELFPVYICLTDRKTARHIMAKIGNTDFGRKILFNIAVE